MHRLWSIIQAVSLQLLEHGDAEHAIIVAHEDDYTPEGSWIATLRCHCPDSRRPQSKRNEHLHYEHPIYIYTHQQII